MSSTFGPLPELRVWRTTGQTQSQDVILFMGNSFVAGRIWDWNEAGNFPGTEVFEGTRQARMDVDETDNGCVPLGFLVQ